MIRKTTLLWFLLVLAAPVYAQKQLDVQKEFAFAAQQYKRLLDTHPDKSRFPHSTNPDGSLRDKPSEWWCSGFFGGSLWYLYEFTKDEKWKTAADNWTMAMAKEQTNTGTHDLGFMLYCPFGNGYRLTQNPAYRPVLLTGAQSLSTRFDPTIGVIKSWNSLGEYTYPVIIDNMMNLELLFWAARQSGDKRLYNVAISHADSTLKNHFRPDQSSYHVVCYAPGGKVLKRQTHQGAADESAWARGQAWGLYGYTVMYRETKDPKYLAQAQRIADFYLNHPNLPADKVPYWDFNAPNIPNEERDASAAAITAAALLELCTYGGASSQPYYRAAVQMLQSLASPAYKAKLGENNNFLLKHSVGAKPLKSEINVPLVYADYYYLEALLRYDALRKQPAYRL
ncbi:glycoside hydrolase family 88 protein [Hymenobacter sp. YC55]|uniref:glycoside hydrolase family 88 protein n=1 Tax=Hymenobacter sp. YC55 TaxID=3034019 RepID=UPI0023F79A21|nr:glycoside hydrolase family 88 protein [Hymenobacter sp. YC55]MDF7813951.1 glycoside hydrolase family 88 protein [Hymenobacter sp. YC55]